ncbi:MAG: hypothetical protein U1F68_05965 [Gammaproteobacteria bacterium]
MALAMEDNESPHPIDIGFLGANAAAMLEAACCETDQGVWVVEVISMNSDLLFTLDDTNFCIR